MRALQALALGLVIAAPGSAASWISVKAGPFVVISPASPKDTKQRAGELEQFRYSLGELLGRHDLTVRPQLQLFSLAQAPALSSVTVTRTGALALQQGPGPLTIETRKQLAHILLSQNIDRIPLHLEHGLETFLSTTEVHGAKVTWGALPPSPERDADWALMHWLITNPDTYGNVRVLLSNLENRVDEEVAFRSAFHKSRDAIQQEAAAYAQSGRFASIDAPSRPLNPERDLPTHTLDPNEVTLRLADLLNAESGPRYRSLLNAGVDKAEAEEGLALLAAQQHDSTAASELLQKALTDGSKNAVAMIAFARLEPDPEKARSVLEKAVAAGPGSAEAHFLLAAKIADPVRQIQEYSLATKLDPRKQEYWVALAQALQNQKQWDQAAKAWRGAEQAAATPEESEKMSAARLAIESQRLDFEDAEKRRAQEAEQRELDRLKQQAIAEIRAAEAKVNHSTAPVETADAIPWEQLDDSAGRHADGTLIRVDCSARTMRLVVRLAGGKLLRLRADPAKLKAVTCGAQKERAVSVTYSAAGEATSVEFR